MGYHPSLLQPPVPWVSSADTCMYEQIYICLHDVFHIFLCMYTVFYEFIYMNTFFGSSLGISVFYTASPNGIGVICRYRVATISRLLKIIGLFCKRALWKRRYSAKQTYNIEDPSKRSHPPPHTPLGLVLQFVSAHHTHATCISTYFFFKYSCT